MRRAADGFTGVGLRPPGELRRRGTQRRGGGSGGRNLCVVPWFSARTTTERNPRARDGSRRPRASSLQRSPTTSRSRQDHGSPALPCIATGGEPTRASLPHLNLTLVRPPLHAGRQGNRILAPFPAHPNNGYPWVSFRGVFNQVRAAVSTAWSAIRDFTLHGVCQEHNQ